MDPFVVGLIGLAVFFILVFAGVPIALAMMAVGFFGLMFIMGFDRSRALLIATIYHQATSQALVVIPLFVFMGLLGALGGISANVYKAITIWMGRFKAAHGIATVLSCTAFGTICGSGVTTAAVFAKVSAPEMRRHGYSKSLAYGICASAGSIGMFIPPSVVMVYYGMITGESVGKLLIGGIGPGLLLTIFFSLGIWIIGRVKPSWVGTAPIRSVTWRERLVAIKLFWPVFVIAAIMIGGIFLGVFSPIEASAIGAVVVLAITMFVSGKDRWKYLWQGMYETATITAMLLLILAGATVLSRFFVITGLSQALLKWVVGLQLTPIQFMWVLVVFYIIMGFFMSSLPLIAMTIPIFYPTVLSMGIDTIWFAMVIIVAIELGGITPPVGVLCFAAKGAAEPDVRLEDIFAGAVPFCFMWFVVVLILMYVPWTATVLPNMLKM